MKRIVRLCEQATAEQRGRALDWYPCARRVVGALALRHDEDPSRVAAVLAITSPMAQLVTNVDWTDTALATRGTVDVGRFPNRMMVAVRAILAGDVSPHEACSGPKVGPFYRAIMGDPDALVLDRWALRVSTGSGRDTIANLRLAERRYRRAAAELELALRETQALAWKVARDAATRSDGVRQTLIDIHEIENRILGS